MQLSYRVLNVLNDLEFIKKCVSLKFQPRRCHLIDYSLLVMSLSLVIISHHAACYCYLSKLIGDFHISDDLTTLRGIGRKRDGH